MRKKPENIITLKSEKRFANLNLGDDGDITSACESVIVLIVYDNKS